MPDGRTEIRTAIIRTNGGPSAVWRHRLGSAFKAAPVVHGSMLLVADTSGSLAALDRRTGRIQWRYESGGEILGGPGIRQGLIVFGSGDGSVHALDEAGRLRWRREIGRPVYGPPLMDGEEVLIGDNGGRLHCLGIADGAPRWTFSRADYSIEARPARWGDLILLGARDGYLYAVDSDGVCYVAGMDGTLTALRE